MDDDILFLRRKGKKNMKSKTETKNSRERAIYRVTIGGSICNFFLLLFKFVAGFIGGSAAMMADAVHSLSDFLTDVVVLLFVRISSKPCDTDHDFGHGKYETLASVFIGLMLAFVGVGIMWSGAENIISVCQGETLEQPGIIALVAALLSIVVKEILYQWTVRVGRQTESSAVVANAWHHRSDALSSIGTALGIGGAILLGPQWRILDPLAAVVVSIFIIKVSLKLFVPSIQELLEKSLPADDEQLIIKTIMQEPGVTDPHNLRTRRIGSNRAIDVHVRMDGDVPLRVAHQATRNIERRLRKHFGTHTFINIHVEPTPPQH